MPEYRCPGVYVEETDAGVPTMPASDDSRWQALADEIRRRKPADTPEWTGHNESDPGTTLLEAFAFLAEGLLFRADEIPERGRAAAFRAAAALTALGRAGEPARGSLERPVFFAGRLLDAATLSAEQDYHREKLRRHNLALLGCGIVSGLAVRVEETGDPGGCRVVVEPGYAIDRDGEEIRVPCGVALAPPARGDSALVTLRFWERARPPDPEPEGAASGMPCVEEACVIGIKPDAAAPAIALARLRRPEGRWQVDPSFVPPRVPPARP